MTAPGEQEPQSAQLVRPYVITNGRGLPENDQFNLITLSIDHRETPELANEYKQGYLKEYARPGAERGWHFLTGDEASIQQLADAIGYRFLYDAPTDSFMHPDGVIILTPTGRVSHYFFRLEYPPRDMKWALIQAGNGKIGSPLDGYARILLPLWGNGRIGVLLGAVAPE